MTDWPIETCFTDALLKPIPNRLSLYITLFELLYGCFKGGFLSPCVEQVLTPTRVGQTYAYSPAPSNSQDLYDVPPLRQQGVGIFLNSQKH